MRNKARISLLTVLLLTAPAFAFEENSLNLGRFDRVDLEAGLLSRNEGPRLAAVCFLGFGNCDTEAGYGGGGEDYHRHGQPVQKRRLYDNFLRAADLCVGRALSV